MHSFTGAWLVLFLIEHLLINSQAALFIGDDGQGFIHAVNGIKNLPYLPFIELFLLGVPILIHMIWGILYLKTGEINSFRGDGTKPSLPQYGRNHAYSWQRITSWILVFLLVGHIVHMRFMEYPSSSKLDAQQYYMVRVHTDVGLYSLAKRLDVQLYNPKAIQDVQEEIEQITIQEDDTPGNLLQEQERQQKKEWLEVIRSHSIQEGEVVAVATDFGTAELLMVREIFKMPVMIALYTILVLSACYHGFNGLWTFLIT